MDLEAPCIPGALFWCLTAPGELLHSWRTVMPSSPSTHSPVLGDPDPCHITGLLGTRGSLDTACNSFHRQRKLPVSGSLFPAPGGASR